MTNHDTTTDSDRDMSENREKEQTPVPLVYIPAGLNPTQRLLWAALLLVSRDDLELALGGAVSDADLDEGFARIDDYGVGAEETL